MLNIEESRKICEAATPGPWCAVNEYREIHERLMSRDESGVLIGNRPAGIAEIDPINRIDNAVFITHARTALPEALDEIERLTSELKSANLRAREYEKLHMQANNSLARVIEENQKLSAFLREGGNP